MIRFLVDWASEGKMPNGFPGRVKDHPDLKKFYDGGLPEGHPGQVHLFVEKVEMSPNPGPRVDFVARRDGVTIGRHAIGVRHTRNMRGETPTETDLVSVEAAKAFLER